MNRRNLFLIAIVCIAAMGFSAKTYRYKCPKCKLIQEYAVQGIKKCPNDGRIMTKIN
jgi:hypothetical protein